MLANYNSPIFGFGLTIIAYIIGVTLSRRYKYTLVNPFLIALIIIISVLQISGMPFETYIRGGDVLTFFLGPATVAIAISVYRQRVILKEYFIPVVLGCTASSITSLVATFLIAPLFGLDKTITASIATGRLTSAIAIEIAPTLGGIVPIAILVVVITGTLGAVLAPFLIKLFKIDDPVVAGVSIGSTSHIVGTAKATELGEIQGAMSGVAIAITGIITVVLTLFL